LNLLKAAAKSGTVKRVIYTSSIAAVHDHTPSGEDAFLRPGNTYTDESWNPVTWEDVKSGPYKNDPGYLYSASKTLAEQAAWEWIKKEKPAFDFVSIATASSYGVPQNPYSSLEDLDHATRRLFHYIGGDLKGTSELPVNIYPTFTALTDTVGPCQSTVRLLLTPN
jgi:nucleoside-diphosphate-sugar epimerase